MRSLQSRLSGVPLSKRLWNTVTCVLNVMWRAAASWNGNIWILSVWSAKKAGQLRFLLSGRILRRSRRKSCAFRQRWRLRTARTGSTGLRLCPMRSAHMNLIWHRTGLKTILWASLTDSKYRFWKERGWKRRAKRRNILRNGSPIF